MSRVYETQTIEVDPSLPVVNLDLDKDFDVLEAAIITNTVKPSGVRELTLALVYEDSVTAQHSLSLEAITVGNNIDVVTNQALGDIQTIQFTEFIDHTIVNDSISVTILTLSIVGVQVNEVTTQKLQFDPSSPITTGESVLATGTLVESHLVNVGSLSKPSSVGAGTLNAIAILVAQQ